MTMIQPTTLAGGKFANRAAYAAFSAILAEGVDQALNDDVIVTGKNNIKGLPKGVSEDQIVRPEIDRNKSYGTWDEGKQALNTAILDAKESGNSNWEYGGITVQEGHGAEARIYNSNIVTSRSADAIYWSKNHLLNINASSPIIALHHNHPLGHNVVPKAFSKGDRNTFRTLRTGGAKNLQGVYMVDKHGVRAFRNGMGENGQACNGGISMC